MTPYTWATSYFLTHFSFRKSIYSISLFTSFKYFSVVIVSRYANSIKDGEYVLWQHTLVSDNIRALLKIDAHVSIYTYLWYAHTTSFLIFIFSYSENEELISLFYHWDSSYRLISGVWSVYIHNIIILSTFIINDMLWYQVPLIALEIVHFSRRSKYVTHVMSSPEPVQ